MRAKRVRDSALGSSDYMLISLVVLTIFVGILAYGLIRSDRDVLITGTQSRVDLQALIKTTIDQETGMRGYAATGDPVFLQPYHEATALYESRLAALRKDLRSGVFAAAEPFVARYDALHARWIRAVVRPLIAQPRGPRTHALQIEGKHDVDAMRREADGAEREVLSVLGTTGVSVDRIIVASILAIVLLTIVLGTAALRTLRARYAQEHALRAEIAERNAALERANQTLQESIDELGRQRTSVIELNQSKNDLIAVLAHDIKGPLTSIVGFAELLEEGYLEGEGATDAARTIRSNAQRLATLANDVLALSRVEHGELEIADERVDLVETLKNAVELHGTERAVTFTSDAESAPVRGDADRLRQVFDNVIRNAIKYSPNGEPVELHLQTTPDGYRVEVSDRGIGVPADELSKLFERFSRATNARKAKIQGTGIGLFIVKMIVERHGGTVGVRSVAGEGSTFSIVLPTIEDGAVAAPRRVSILSADRNLSRFATYELRSRGYRVRESTSVEELVGDGDVRPGDVILADAGTASANELRERFAGGHVRVVGIGDDGDGWDANLPKPFLVADLVAAVSSDGANR